MKKTLYPTGLNLKVRIAVLATLVALLTFSSLHAQCSVVGSGQVTGNVNFGSSNNWANPNRCTITDDLWSRCQLAPGETSKYLEVSDYGWVIPVGATIEGIEVKIECHQEDFVANFADASIVLMQYGSIVGSDRAGTGYYDDKDYTNTYGSPTDLWGTTWTPADVMDPGFGVLYSVTRLSGPDDPYYMFVDYVELTVYYSGSGCILPVTYRAYDVQLEANKTVKINWSTANETNADQYNVQRSIDGVHFEAIGSVPATGNPETVTDYNYVDQEILNGTAFYRLEQVDLNGSVAYTDVRAITNDGTGSLTVRAFPNPAMDHLQLTGNLAGGQAQIFDLSGKMVLQESLASNASTLDVSTLGNGMYFLKVQNETRHSTQRIVIQ